VGWWSCPFGRLGCLIVVRLIAGGALLMLPVVLVLHVLMVLLVPMMLSLLLVLRLSTATRSLPPCSGPSPPGLLAVHAQHTQPPFTTVASSPHATILAIAPPPHRTPPHRQPVVPPPTGMSILDSCCHVCVCT
jgi:hypothetical protein